MPGGYPTSYKRSRDGDLVVPIDELRGTDTGILTSFGGAVASGALYVLSSGVEVFLQSLILTPFSGQNGPVQLLDGTTVKSLPVIAIPGGSGAVGTQVIPFANIRFQSALNVQTISGLALNIPQPSNATPAIVFAGAIQAVVMVDPRVPEEG